MVVISVNEQKTDCSQFAGRFIYNYDNDWGLYFCTPARIYYFRRNQWTRRLPIRNGITNKSWLGIQNLISR